MNDFKIKDFVLVLLLTYLFFVTLIVLEIGGGRVNSIDLAFVTALRFSLPLLTLILPFRKVSINFVLYVVSIFFLGNIFPLIQLDDYGQLMYLWVFVKGLIMVALIAFFTRSRFTQATSAIMLIFIITILGSIMLSYSAYNSVKTEAKQYAAQEAYGYLRCNGNNLSQDKFQNICNNLTGKFWQPYYQNICFDELKNLKSSGTISKSFNSCSSMSSSNGAEYKFTNYFVRYWKFKSVFGF